MPRNIMTKDELKCRVLKLKNQIHEGMYNGASDDWLDGAHHSLNKVLDILQEYSD